MCRCSQAFGDELQHIVADHMPEDVVDLLEAIDIDAEHHKAFAPISRRRRGCAPDVRGSLRGWAAGSEDRDAP